MALFLSFFNSTRFVFVVVFPLLLLKGCIQEAWKSTGPLLSFLHLFRHHLNIKFLEKKVVSAYLAPFVLHVTFGRISVYSPHIHDLF